LSTFEAYFKGKKELFKGLAIEQLEQNWFEYPVLHLDLNAEKYDSKERLEKMLEFQLAEHIDGCIHNNFQFDITMIWAKITNSDRICARCV